MKHAFQSVGVTLILISGLSAQEARPATDSKNPTTPKPDPAATRLFQEARASRALWQSFPGFSADIEVNLDGKISRGQVRIDSRGKVTLEGLDREAGSWARTILNSDVTHRMASESSNLACAFADEDTTHPLGRAIILNGDGMGSSYRVRDRQIVMVNRTMGKSRFSITLLESRLNKEGKYLPSSYVVHYWDTEAGQLQKTEAFTSSFVRVGVFDLPATTRLITTARQVSVKSLSLSGHRLLDEKK